MIKDLEILIEVLTSIIFTICFLIFILWFGLTNQCEHFYSQQGIEQLNPVSVWEQRSVQNEFL